MRLSPWPSAASAVSYNIYPLVSKTQLNSLARSYMIAYAVAVDSKVE